MSLVLNAHQLVTSESKIIKMFQKFHWFFVILIMEIADSASSSSTLPSTTEMFTNNVENFHKSVKSRNFEREGGPSIGVDFDPRASFAQVYLAAYYISLKTILV